MARKLVNDPVTVVTAGGVPQELAWRGAQWTVTDRPTLWVERDHWWALPPAAGVRRQSAGFPVWRAQVSPTDSSHVPVVIDVAFKNDQWLVLNVFD